MQSLQVFKVNPLVIIHWIGNLCIQDFVGLYDEEV